MEDVYLANPEIGCRFDIVRDTMPNTGAHLEIKNVVSSSCHPVYSQYSGVVFAVVTTKSLNEKSLTYTHIPDFGNYQHFSTVLYCSE